MVQMIQILRQNLQNLLGIQVTGLDITQPVGYT